MDSGSFEIIPLNDADASFSNGSMRVTSSRRQSAGIGRRSSHRRATSLSSSAFYSSQSRKRNSVRRDLGPTSSSFGNETKPPVPEIPPKKALTRKSKRKSDELDGIDIAKIVSEHELENELQSRAYNHVSFDDSVNDYNNSSDVFIRKNTGPSLDDSSDSSQDVKNPPRKPTSIFCSKGNQEEQPRPTRSIFDDMAFVAETFQCDFGGITGRSEYTADSATVFSSARSASPSSCPPSAPQTPMPHDTVRDRSKESNSMIYKGGYQPYNLHHGDSPCEVTGLFNNGCGSFWNRSLAWSDDEEDDSDVSDRQDRRAFQRTVIPKAAAENRSIVREHLSVPSQLGNEHANNDDDASNTTSGRFSAPTPANSVATSKSIPRRSSSNSLNSYNRVKTLETDSRHRKGSKMFRQTEIDNVTEIHWEESLVDLDSGALDLMSKLSLS